MKNVPVRRSKQEVINRGGEGEISSLSLTGIMTDSTCNSCYLQGELFDPKINSCCVSDILASSRVVTQHFTKSI